MNSQPHRELVGIRPGHTMTAARGYQHSVPREQLHLGAVLVLEPRGALMHQDPFVKLLIAPVGGVPAGHDPLDRRPSLRGEHLGQLFGTVPARNRIHSPYRPLRVHGLDCIGGRERGPDAAARSSVSPALIR